MRFGDKLFYLGGLSLIFSAMAENTPAKGVFATFQDYMRDFGITPDQALTAWGIVGFAVMCYGIYQAEGEQMAAARKGLEPTPTKL